VTKLSVNLNKFALLRNSRGTDSPNLIRMATRCITAGVHGITVHPRPDQRHIRYADVADLAALLKDHPSVEFNIEGNPIPAFLDLVQAVRPRQCTLVPDSPAQLTSDHGWNLQEDAQRLQPIVVRLKGQGTRVSLFMDPDPAQIDVAQAIGADRIELYTEPYARAFGTASQEGVLARFRHAAPHAQAAGLGVNAGHDLNQLNLPTFLTIPGTLEVSIGHAIVVESFDYGLERTLARYLAICTHQPC
jgi:pyridoxine 5-phosphate synthase